MAGQRGRAFMLRNIVFPSSVIPAPWEYVATKFVSDGNPVTFTEADGVSATKAHRIIAINYCTANGTATTTDSVIVDAPTISSSSTSPSVVFNYVYQDNAGDEGTGYHIIIADVPVGATSISSAAQTVEDYYGSIAFLFSSSSATDMLESKQFVSSRNDSTGEGSFGGTYPAIALWSITQAGTASLQESGVSDGTVSGLSNNASALVLFYHGYGTNFSQASAIPGYPTDFAILRRTSGDNTNPYSPLAKTIFDPQAVSGSSSYAVGYVFSGKDFNGLSEILYVTNTQYAQGDCMMAIQF